ncbi:MAG: hypothetical protein VYE68_01125 [Acidobacteriota bacterium]|nr:hypothetical protein [Acidobacteriota bacterium]
MTTFYVRAATDSNVVRAGGLQISEIATDTIQVTALMMLPSPIGVGVTQNLSIMGLQPACTPHTGLS